METPSFYNQEEIKPNPIKSEHLIEGVEPIMTCVGTEDQYGEDLDRLKIHGNDINYYTLKIDRDERFLGSNKPGYVMSNINEDIKFTKKLYDCTSVVAVGNDLITGKNISFLTHQDSMSISQDDFQKDLERCLMELKDRCHDGSIDVMIAGGQLVPERMQSMHYPKSLKNLNDVIVNTLGFEPVVACGPKHIENNSYDDVYFDTENRRLYVIRPKDSAVYNDSFISKDLGDMNEKWKKLDK